MKKWLEKWLPIIMGCHQRPERSFWYKGKPFPICARCTGILIGFVSAFLCVWFVDLKIKWCVLMLLPMIIDGGIQQRSSYESNNLKRVITGTLFGFGITYLMISSLIGTYHWGFEYGFKLKSKLKL